MITLTQAISLITKNVCKSKKVELTDTDKSYHRVLSCDYYSKTNLPTSDVSAMDGAVILKNEKMKKLKIIGESKAGDVKGIKINNQECVLIYTGAPIDGKDKKVVPKENFETVNNHIHIKKVSTDSFVRKKGSDLIKDKKYLCKKSVMNIRSIVLARSMKIKKLKVFKKPKVFVICTGDEIIASKNSKSVVETTNNIFIEYFVKLFGGEIVKINFSRDNCNDFLRKFKSQKKFDLLITSGGISKGKYDIVKKSLQKVGLNILFDRVAIKPGKPTTFGKFNQNKYFLGLPGNPVSCFVSLLNFLPIFINSFYGFNFVNFNLKEFSSKNFIENNTNLTQFKRVIIKNNYFELISNQDSSLINMLSISNGILLRKPFAKAIKKKEKAKILTFDNF